MKLSNTSSKQSQHAPSKNTNKQQFNKLSNMSKKTVQLYQTNRKGNQKAHAANQHDHSQSNQETEIKNKHSNKQNKPKQSKPPAN
jgi:hypothetical protein